MKQRFHRFHSKPSLFLLFFLCVLLLFIDSSSVQAKKTVSPSVPILNSVYDDLEILISHRLIHKPFKGYRPYTRQQFINWINKAEKNLELRQKEYSIQKHQFINSVLERMKRFFSEEHFSRQTNKIRIQPLNTLDIKTVYLNQVARPYFNQSSRLQGSALPLVQWDSGRHYNQGLQYAIETTHDVAVEPYFTVFFQPRMQIQLVDNAQAKSSALFVQQLYLGTNFWNTQIEIGRKEIIWGLSRYGGMLFSSNARPLDGLFVTNAQPWRAGFLGKIKYSWFMANLGPEQNFAYPYISGIKLGIQPTQWLEFNIARALIFKGDGAPDGSALDFFMEYFGVRPGDINTINLSNSINGFEFLLSLSFFRNTEIYGEYYFEDFNFSHIIRSFYQDAAILMGVYVPRLDDKASMSLRVEGRKTASICYKHGRWTDGWTLNDHIMADPLGPDAESLAFFLNKRFDNELSWLSSFYLERIDSDIYESHPTKGRVVNTNGTAEKRIRLLTALQYQLTNAIQIQTSIGYERVYNYGFIQENDQNDFLISLNFHVNPAFLLRKP